MPNQTATLNVASISVCYSDLPPNANPKRKFWDWVRQNSQITVENPKSENWLIEPYETKTIFSGTRTLTLDESTVLVLTNRAESIYRMAYSSGTLPGFRTAASVDLSGISTVFVANANGTVAVAAADGFANVTAGMEVFIPGVATGDAAGPFNAMNVGWWKVLAKADSSNITLARPDNSVQALTETVTPVATADFQVYSATGVQIGDMVSFDANVPVAMQSTFEVSALTAKWIEFISTTPMPLSNSLSPGADGLVIYSGAKRYLRVESDQEIAITTNASMVDTRQQRIVPLEAGNQEMVGWFEQFGPVWSLIVHNRSSTAASVTVISAE